MRLSELGEFGLLAELERRGLAHGIGDDAALVEGVVVTQDSLVEGVHFRLDLIGWQELGFRAAAVNVSDLSASGAEPRALVVGLGLRGDAAVEDVLALYEGLAEAGVPVVGGDTTRAERLFVSVTALGRAERVPGRAGAVPGDAVVVTGPLGAGGAAFRQGRLAPPPVRVEEGRALARVAHAMLDVSDGLAGDAAHIARRSGCRVVIELERVPLAPGATVDDLGFGEDYELLAALAPEDVAATGYAAIGTCTEGEGVELLLDGRPHRLAAWDHFSQGAQARS